MQRIRFINKLEKEIYFCGIPPFLCSEVRGIGIDGVEPVTFQSPFQAGYSLKDILINSREITLNGAIHSKDNSKNVYKYRQELNSILNPTLGLGKIIYENNNKKLFIEAFVKDIEYGKMLFSHGVQQFSITFECPDPYFKAMEEDRVVLSYLEGGITFPLETPSEFGIYGYLIDIENDGDAPLPIDLLLDGGALNPVIKNEVTGEFIQVFKRIEPWEKLYVNTDPLNLEVSILSTNPKTNRVEKRNAYGHLTYNSSLFRLTQGLNTITFRSEDEKENKRVKCEIKYRKMYLGL